MLVVMVGADAVRLGGGEVLGETVFGKPPGAA